MVFERYRLERQLQQLEERRNAFLSFLKNVDLPVDKGIYSCFLSKLSKELSAMFDSARSRLASCREKKCYDEVAKILSNISQYLATLEGEARHFHGSKELELKVFFREIFECKEQPSLMPIFSNLFQQCFVEVGLEKVERELKATEEDLQRLQASEGVHPCLYPIWKKLLNYEENLLGEASKKLTSIKEVVAKQPCEAMETLSALARLSEEARNRLDEYKSLKIELFSLKAVEGFIPPHADKIFESEEDVRQMLNTRIFERLYSLLYRILPSVEAERIVESLIKEYAKCIWSEIKR